MATNIFVNLPVPFRDKHYLKIQLRNKGGDSSPFIFDTSKNSANIALGFTAGDPALPCNSASWGSFALTVNAYR